MLLPERLDAYMHACKRAHTDALPDISLCKSAPHQTTCRARVAVVIPTHTPRQDGPIGALGANVSAGYVVLFNKASHNLGYELGNCLRVLGIPYRKASVTYSPQFWLCVSA